MPRRTEPQGGAERDESGRPPRRQGTKRRGASPAASDDVGPVFAEVVRRSDAFCAEHLDAEYADLCRMVAENLAAEQPSPLLKGTVEGWVGGIVYTVGWVNFLSDPSQKPHIKTADLVKRLGVSQSTAISRSNEIRKLYGLGVMDPRLTRGSLMNDNPLAWMIELENGFIDDARRYPRSVQQKLADAGLIPYVHPDAVDDTGLAEPGVN